MPHSVLFLCTSNTARSIMAEALLNALGGGRFRAFSAGSQPASRVDPVAIEVLFTNGYPVSGTRCKGWDEFARGGAPALDFVITVCDAVAGCPLPAFPGAPVIAHWGVPDPAAARGSDDERRPAYVEVLGILRRRVQALTGLPFASVDRLALREQVREIGLM